MAHDIRTVLRFTDRGREAATFHCGLIPNSRLERSYASDTGGPDGNMPFEVIDFTLNGLPCQILEAGPMFPLSACVSVMVKTPDQAKTDRLWDVHGPCGWLKDRYGLSWQVVPARVHDLMTDPDTARAGRAPAAVMQMGKIDIATVDAAARKAA